jgi:ribonucleoside-diphosphate reductase alpha chain
MELSENAQQVVESRYFWEGETKWEQLVERVCRENSKNEINNFDKWYEEFRSIIEPMDFIPAGRILRNLGKLRPSTSNCNFLPIDDSIESIAETLKSYLIISSYGGGNGINFSSLRPKSALLKTKGGKSSGMVSFIEMFNSAGKRIETGGQRRAAGIALCDVSHPDIYDFINAKVKEDRITQFNISVIVNDEFLRAVEEDVDWNLQFAGQIYKTVRAKEVWDMILNNMLEHSEPGLVNWDNLIKNNSFYFAPIHGTNPCSEVPLENFGVCNLGSLVLPNFIINKNTDWRKLSKAVRLAVRFLDNIIDLAYYPIPQQETVVKNARRVGLGTMGLADYLFIKELRYGSEKALAEIEKLYRFIRDEAYIASVDLAKEKGAFPKYDRVEYNKASFIRKLPAKIRMYIKDNSIRNTTLLVAAPTGTTSLLADVTSGIEPLPFKGYLRTDGVGDRIYIHPLAKDYYDADWFVDSYDLKPEEHFETQVILQKYLDSGVSKTIILPKDATTNDLSKLLLEYIRDLKGVTVYRDESRQKQVYYRLSKDQIDTYLEKGVTVEGLSEEDVSCSSGACDL